MIPETYSFPRFLAAKQSLDDRSLNRPVWARLQEQLAQRSPGAPLRVLEVGAGIGTMVERALAWGLLECAAYTALDSDAENIAIARRRIPAWAEAHGWQAAPLEDGGIRLSQGAREVTVDFQLAELFEFCARPAVSGAFDLLIAHAFLDLLDIPAALPRLLDLLAPGGSFYFSLNFDGVTAFEPEIDPRLDALIERLYHQTMDERITGGRPSGDSRAGRRLFSHLRQAGVEILAAGASDWVVFPHREDGAPGGEGASGGRASSAYPGDEAYFLHHILHFVETSLAGRTEIEPAQIAHWIACRRAQVEAGELVYLAHQVDFVGRRGA